MYKTNPDMEILQLTQQQIDALNRPLPAEAVTPHPTKKFLSSIKSIYVTERLNEVFGIGRWSIKSEVVENHDKMVVVKATFSVTSYGIEYECYGGNDNADRGDAYKGATTDALTKIGSWLGIGADVFKGKHDKTAKPAQAQRVNPPAPRPTITSSQLDDKGYLDRFLSKLYEKKLEHEEFSESFDPIEFLDDYYFDLTEQVKNRIVALFNSYIEAQNNKN